MEEETQPWWRMLWNATAFIVGLLALSALVMTSIVFTVKFFDVADKPSSARDTSPARSMATESADKPAAGMAGMQANMSWPSSPSLRYARGAKAAPGRSGGDSQTGLSAEEYQAVVDAGGKVKLPNPAGECNLGAVSGPDSARALQSCFSSQAVR